MPSADVFERIPSGDFAGAVESYDAAHGIENGNECTDGIENRRDHVAFLLQVPLGVFQIGDVESYAVDEPRRSIGVAHHACVAVEPDDSAVTGHDAVGGAEWLAGEEHAGRFNAPAMLVVRMDASIPTDGIFEPVFARIAECSLDFRTDVGLTDAAIE